MQKNILSILIKFKIPRNLFKKKKILVSNLHVQKYIRIKYKINKFFLSFFGILQVVVTCQ